MSNILEKALNKIQDSIVGRFDSGNTPDDELSINPKIVPDPEEGEEYVTHRYVNEQDDEEEETPEESPEETADTSMGDMGEDTTGGLGDTGSDMGGMGGFGNEENKDKPANMDELGRRYELKKIYARLVSLESNLSNSSEIELLKLRGYVSQAIDLFKTMIYNIDLFKDNIDDIIVIYYEFLKYSYSILKKFYEEREDDK